MDYMPKGANFTRAKMLWEIQLHIAANPLTPYGGNRDFCMTVGSGGGAEFKPWLRMATGSAIMAEDVAKGALEIGFVNPAALLTQAVLGKGIFTKPLPLKILANYPAWDWCLLAVHKRTGIHSLNDLVKAKYPLKLSIREDPTHSSLVLLDQTLALAGTSQEEIKSWGGEFQLVGPPGDKRRIAALNDEIIDAVFDEGVNAWFAPAMTHNYTPVVMEPEIIAGLEALGWRKAMIPAGRFAGRPEETQSIDFSGWPLYCHDDLPEKDAYDFCAAIAAREEFMPWEARSFVNLEQLWTESHSTPMDVALHPGAERWFREHFGKSTKG